MNLSGLWRLLHLFFAFSFVGSLVVAEWNGRAARVTQDWSQRALLFNIVFLSSRVAGFGSLFLLGIFGNVLSVTSGYSMGSDWWLRWVNLLWLAALAAMVVLILPNARKLADSSRSAAGGESPTGYESTLP